MALAMTDVSVGKTDVSVGKERDAMYSQGSVTTQARLVTRL